MACRNREDSRAYSRRYYAEHKAERLAYKREWTRADRAKNPEKYRRRELARWPKRREAGSNYRAKYGFSSAEYRAFISTPCDICGTTDRRRVVDHDHATGEVRGRLCDLCNQALGKLQDNPALLRSATEYLERVLS